MNNDTINKVLREICDMQAENYGNGIDTHIDLIALCARGREALATSAAPSGIEAIEHGTLKREAFANDLAYGIYLSERAESERSGKLADADMVDLMGVKPNGETVLLGKVAMPSRMKAKELIRELIGGDFEDDDSDASMWLYAFERFAEFVNSQHPAPEADSSSAAPSEICECDGDSHKEECPVMVARNWPDLDRLAAPSPTRESLNEKPCVGCNGAGVIGTPGMPCPFCPVEKKLREFEAALVTPRQTSDPAAEDERLSKRIGATKGALASALRRPCVVKLEPGSSPSPFDPVFTTVTLDAEIPPPHQTEDGSRLSAAIDRGADGDWLWSRFMTLCKKHGVNEGGPLGNDLFGIVSDLRGLAPKETAVQGGVPEAEPVAWIRKTDITELTDSEPETNGWTPLYAAPTGASK